MDARTQYSRDDYTVGWICALPVERAAAELMLDKIHPPLPRPSVDQNTYTLGSIGEHNIVIASLPSGAYGKNSATPVAMQLLSSFHAVRIGLMVGIAGGVPRENVDIRLGDIVVSKPTDTSGGVIQYDLGKALSDGGFNRTGMLNRPPKVLLTALTTLQAHHLTKDSRVIEFVSDLQAKIEPDKAGMFTRPTQEDLLFQAEYDHVVSDTCMLCDRSKLLPRPPREYQEPVIHYGLIGSANQVMKDGRRRDQLARDLDIYCVEMEAAGLTNDFPCLVIRGICDYADSHKNKEWQGYAAAVAAAFAKELLLIVPIDEINRTPTTLDTLTDSGKRIPISPRIGRDLWARGYQYEDQKERDLLQTLNSGYEDQKERDLLQTLNSGYKDDKNFNDGGILISPEIDVVEDIAGELEDFILLSRLGLFDDAEKFFEENLKSYLNHFPVFIEYADMLRAAGKFDELSSHLGRKISRSASEDRLCKLIALLGAVQAKKSISVEARRQKREALIAALSWHDEYNASSDDFDELDMHITEVYLEILVNIGFDHNGNDAFYEIIDFQVDKPHVWDNLKFFFQNDKYYQPPGLQGNNSLAARWSGFVEWCLELNKQQRYWEAQRVFSLLLQLLRGDEVEPLFERYLHGLKTSPLTASTAVASLAAHNAMLKWVLIDPKRWICDEKLSPILIEAINIGPSLSYLFRDMKVVKGCQFEEWQNGMLELSVQAVHSQKEEQVISLLLEAATKYGKPPLLWALKRGEKRVSKYILDHYDVELPTAERQSLLFEAAEKGNEITLKYILDDKNIDLDVQDKDGRTPLIWAAINGNEVIIRSMLNTGKVHPDSADYKGWTALSWAAAEGHLSIVHILLNTPGVNPDSTDRTGRTPLSWAASKGHTSVVKILLADERVNANFPDGNLSTPLFWAINKGNEASVSLLFDRVEDPDATNSRSRTLLSYAAERGLEGIVKQLLECVKNPDAGDENLRTPLSYVAERGHLGIAQLLLDKADPNKRDSEDFTPLMYASRRGHDAIVELLLEKADPDLQNNNGYTALMYALDEGHGNVVRLLREKSMRVNQS